MPRHKRCEFQGAIHLATLSGYGGGHIFYDPRIFEQFSENPRSHAPNAEQFDRLLWESCEQYDARIHAYLIESNTARIVIQTNGAPLGWITHDLLARYSTQLIEQHQIPESQRPFPHRYKAQIVQPSKLPYAVRYVQRRRVTSDPRRRAINYPFSSHQIYCGRRPRPEYFVVSTMLDALANLRTPAQLPISNSWQPATAPQSPTCCPDKSSEKQPSLNPCTIVASGPSSRLPLPMSF